MNTTVQAYPITTKYNPAFKNTATKKLPKCATAALVMVASAWAADKAAKTSPCYVPEYYFSNKSAKESAKVFKEEQKMINTFAKGSKEDIFKIIDEKGAEYVTKANNKNTLITYTFLNNSAEVINGIIDKLGLDVILERQKGYYNPVETACIYNNDPEAVEAIYDRIVAEKGIGYITEKNEENNEFSLVDNTFLHNSADVLNKLIKKFGKDIFLTTTSEYYAPPVELASRYNEHPEAVWLMCQEFQGYDKYVKTNEYPDRGGERVYERNIDGEEVPVMNPILLNRADNDDVYIANIDSKGKPVIVDNPIFLYINGRISPLSISARDNEHKEVIDYIYYQLNFDKDVQDIFVEDVFKYNPHPNVVGWFVETVGKDEVAKREQNSDGTKELSYLDKAFKYNENPEVIGALIDKFGPEELIKKESKYGEQSTLDRFFHYIRIRDDAVTKKIVEKLGPIVIRNNSAYPLMLSNHYLFDKGFGKIISEDSFED